MSHFYNPYGLPPPAMRPHPPPSPTDEAIVQQVDWYMGRPNLQNDEYLKSKMDDDLWVSLDVILAFPKMKRIGVTDKHRVASLLHARSHVVEVDEPSCRIRPFWARRSALILHDVPPLTRFEHVMLLFQLNNSNSNPSDRSKQPQHPQSQLLLPHQQQQPQQPPPPTNVHPISESSWIVNFDSPTAAQAFLPLVSDKSINGHSISVELVPDVLRSPHPPAVHDPFRPSSQPAAALYTRPINTPTPPGAPIAPHEHLHLSVSAAAPPPFAPHPALSSPMLSPMPLPMPVLHPHHPPDMHPPPFASPYNPNGGTPPPVPHSAPPHHGTYTYATASMPMPRPPFLGPRAMPPPSAAYIMPYQAPAHFDPSAVAAAAAAAHVPIQAAAAQMQGHNQNHSHGLPHNPNHHIPPHTLPHHHATTHHSNVLPHSQSPILQQAGHGLIAHGSPTPTVASDVGRSSVVGNGSVVTGSARDGASGGGGGGGGSATSGLGINGSTESTKSDAYKSKNARKTNVTTKSGDPSSDGSNAKASHSNQIHSSSSNASIGAAAEQLNDVNIKNDPSSRSPDSLVSFPTDTMSNDGTVSNGDLAARVSVNGKLSMSGTGNPTPEDRLSTPSFSNTSIDVPTTPRQSDSSRFTSQRRSNDNSQSAPSTPQMSGTNYSRPQSNNISNSHSHHSHMSHHGSGHNHGHGHNRHHYHNHHSHHHNSNHHGGANGNNAGNWSNGGYGNGGLYGGRDRHHPGRSGTNFEGGMRYNNHYNHHHSNHHHNNHNNHYNHGHHGHHNHGHHSHHHHHVSNGNHSGNGHNNGQNHTPHTQHHPHGHHHHHHHHHGGMQGRGPGSSFDGSSRGFTGQSHNRKGKKGGRGQHNNHNNHNRQFNHERYGSDPRMRNNNNNNGHHYNNHSNNNASHGANTNGGTPSNANPSANGMDNRSDSSTTVNNNQSTNNAPRVDDRNSTSSHAQQQEQQATSGDDPRGNTTTNPSAKVEPNLATMDFPPLGINANANPASRNSATVVAAKKNDLRGDNSTKDGVDVNKSTSSHSSGQSNVATASGSAAPSGQSGKNAGTKVEKAKVPDVESTELKSASPSAVAGTSESTVKDTATTSSSNVSAGNSASIVKSGGKPHSSPPFTKDASQHATSIKSSTVTTTASGTAGAKRETKDSDNTGGQINGPGRHKHAAERRSESGGGMSYAAILRSKKPTPVVRPTGKNGIVACGNANKGAVPTPFSSASSSSGSPAVGVVNTAQHSEKPAKGDGEGAAGGKAEHQQKSGGESGRAERRVTRVDVSDAKTKDPRDVKVNRSDNAATEVGGRVDGAGGHDSAVVIVDGGDVSATNKKAATDKNKKPIADGHGTSAGVSRDDTERVHAAAPTQQTESSTTAAAAAAAAAVNGTSAKVTGGISTGSNEVDAVSNSGSSTSTSESGRSNLVWANKPKSVFEAMPMKNVKADLSVQNEVKT